MKQRTKARGWILQVLYAWEMRGGDVGVRALGERTLAERAAGEEVGAFVLRHLEVLDERLAEIDALLSERTANWEIQRLSAIDRNILRLAVCELLAFPDVPFKVVIDEAVKLARRYGGDDSPRFVNGVLDAVRLRLERASAEPG